MPKPLNQRGFKVSKGDSRYNLSYEIDWRGLEKVDITKSLFDEKYKSYVFITLDDGEIKSLSYSTSQFDDSDDMEGEEWKIKSKQAMEIYHETKKILNVEEKLKNYSPRFSNESEITPFNVLGLDNISQLESFVRGGK